MENRPRDVLTLQEHFSTINLVLYLFTILLFETCHQYIQKLINEHIYMTV